MEKNSKKTMRINPDQPFEAGKCYLIRTVTHYVAGTIVCVGKSEIVMRDAAWIADTGRFSDALRLASFNEIEPYPEGSTPIVGRGSIIDAVRINPTSPFVQK